MCIALLVSQPDKSPALTRLLASLNIWLKSIALPVSQLDKSNDVSALALLNILSMVVTLLVSQPDISTPLARLLAPLNIKSIRVTLLVSQPDKSPIPVRLTELWNKLFILVTLVVLKYSSPVIVSTFKSARNRLLMCGPATIGPVNIIL